MNPSKEGILAFQATWMRRAGLMALAGSILIAGSLAVGRLGVPSPDDSADQLLNYQDHGGQLVLAAVISSLGLLSFAAPLYFLFRSALARPLPEHPSADRPPPRMRSWVGAFVILGPLFIAVQGTLFALSLNDSSDKFAAGLPAKEAAAREAAAKGEPVRNDDGVTSVSTTVTRTVTTTTTTPKGATTTAAKTQTIPEGACTKPVDDCVDEARDDFVDDTVQDSSLYAPAQITGLLGTFALFGSVIYTLIWAMRTGLLTRFMATVGMMFVAALLLIPPLGPFGLVLWFAVLGLMFLGIWPRPLSPAWAAAKAMPWPKAGQDIGPPTAGPGGTVEGSGRQVSEPPLPENGQGDLSGETPPFGETQGQRRKKRKRRD